LEGFFCGERARLFWEIRAGFGGVRGVTKVEVKYPYVASESYLNLYFPDFHYHSSEKSVLIFLI
jgi:hypothetical protein